MGATGQESFSTYQFLFSNSVPATTFDREGLAKKAMELTTSEFIETRILPLVHERSVHDPVDAGGDSILD